MKIFLEGQEVQQGPAEGYQSNAEVSRECGKRNLLFLSPSSIPGLLSETKSSSRGLWTSWVQMIHCHCGTVLQKANAPAGRACNGRDEPGWGWVREGLPEEATGKLRFLG